MTNLSDSKTGGESFTSSIRMVTGTYTKLYILATVSYLKLYFLTAVERDGEPLSMANTWILYWGMLSLSKEAAVLKIPEVGSITKASTPSSKAYFMRPFKPESASDALTYIITMH